ncbi:MAG: phosphoribosylaminoimidazolesuccinocarboxamide synthase [Planctomycetes bacterium]|nr:phosphoribosylaminoimidazolesuccinocarboxamide synthase [Planctomycetota bacterium]
MSAGQTSDSPTVLSTSLRSAEKLGAGKVRDLYRLGDDLLLVTTDRISAFDVVMDRGIPGKGRVLTSVSAFWFAKLRHVVANHLLSVDVDAWPELAPDEKDQLRGRTMRCRRARPLPVEWVVRGYLTGSGWKDYQAEGRVSGVELPPGLQHASRIEPAILTPSTKAETGHDEPISFAQVERLVGPALAARARNAALALYEAGRTYAAERGIVIADTKFEFGTIGGELVLIDECLTPDSSRFWPADEVRPGGKPTSFDKQVLRDWLSGLDWNKQPPPPPLPDEVVERTARTYADIEARLCR